MCDSHIKSACWLGGGVCWSPEPLSCQDTAPRHRVADSSSTKALSFSSARTTKRLPSSRCASATKIVRPLQSKADMECRLAEAGGPLPDRSWLEEDPAGSRQIFPGRAAAFTVQRARCFWFGMPRPTSRLLSPQSRAIRRGRSRQRIPVRLDDRQETLPKRHHARSVVKL